MNYIDMSSGLIPSDFYLHLLCFTAGPSQVFSDILLLHGLFYSRIILDTEKQK